MTSTNSNSWKIRCTSEQVVSLSLDQGVLTDSTLTECMKSINQNIDKTFESIGPEDIRANKQSQRFSEEQSHSLKRGLSNKQPIILKGWPGTGKTFTGTHFLISRLVNQFIKSTKTLYLPENEPKGLIVCKPKTQSFSQITPGTQRVPKRPLESLAAVGFF